VEKVSPGNWRVIGIPHRSLDEAGLLICNRNGIGQPPGIKKLLSLRDILYDLRVKRAPTTVSAGICPEDNFLKSKGCQEHKGAWAQTCKTAAQLYGSMRSIQPELVMRVLLANKLDACSFQAVATV
jgi:hypothetical protein